MKSEVINYLLDIFPELKYNYVYNLVHKNYDRIVSNHNRINDKYGIVTELTIEGVAMALTTDIIKDGMIES